MDNPIVEKILKDGINSVNLSMLDDISRKRILSDVGDKLYKENKIKEAIEILSSVNDFEKLTKMGDDFILQGKGEFAALCFIPTKDRQRLSNSAVLCINAKNYKLAAKAYQAADNQQMAEFILQNFA